MSTNAPIPPAALSVTAVMQAINLSRAAVYAEINSKRLRSFKAGRRRLIPADALPEWIKAMEGRTAA